MPGKQSFPTQPEVAIPAPMVSAEWPGVSTIAGIASFDYCSRKTKHLRYDGRFTPPSLKASLIYPATAGGVEWVAGAIDFTSGTYVVNSSSGAQIYQLLARRDYISRSRMARIRATSR